MVGIRKHSPGEQEESRGYLFYGAECVECSSGPPRISSKGRSGKAAYDCWDAWDGDIGAGSVADYGNRAEYGGRGRGGGRRAVFGVEVAAASEESGRRADEQYRVGQYLYFCGGDSQWRGGKSGTLFGDTEYILVNYGGGVGRVVCGRGPGESAVAEHEAGICKRDETNCKCVEDYTIRIESIGSSWYYRTIR